MQFDASTPRREITIKGAVFYCPEPYSPGHVCNEGEANALNQTFAENLRNNIVGKNTKKENGQETYTPPTQEEFDAYALEYEFGVRKGGGGSEARLTPVEREARRIARDRLDVALKAQDKKIDRKTEAGKELYESLVAKLAARDDIKREAEKRLKSIEKISLEELDLAA